MCNIKLVTFPNVNILLDCATNCNLRQQMSSAFTCWKICLSMSSAGSCLASELSFLLEPSDVIAVRERPLMLDCQVQGEEPIIVTWHKNGVPLTTSPRVQVLANGSMFIQSFLKRREGSNGDIGEYNCAAQNRYGMLVSRKAKVLLACKHST